MKQIYTYGFLLLASVALLVGCGQNGEASVKNSSKHLQTLTDANFGEVVLASDKPVLVDFWATWCGPCKRVAPVVSALADDYAGKAVVGKVDVDSNEAVSAKYAIQSLPTLLVFKDGKEVARLIGVQSKAALAAKLDAALAGS